MNLFSAVIVIYLLIIIMIERPKIKSFLHNIYNNGNTLLYFLWCIGFLYMVLILILWLCNISISEQLTKLLPAVGIILASFIASASVMKSIEAAKDLKETETRKLEKREFMFFAHTCIQLRIRHNKFTEFVNSREISVENFHNLKNACNTNLSLWEKIFIDKYFKFLDSDSHEYFFHISNALYSLDSLFKKEMAINETPESYIEDLISDELFINTFAQADENLTLLTEVIPKANPKRKEDDE